MSIPSKSLKIAIRAYQMMVSPFLGTNCRFTPTCSRYALEAVDKHGSIKGSYLACKRLLCCHPFAKKSGHDPVPPLNNHSKIKRNNTC